MVGCAPQAAEVPGARQAVVENVQFYPACGNETLTLDGVTWYPFVPEDSAAFPAPLALASGDLAGPGTSRGTATSRDLPAVAAPGPGDDTGSLVIYDGGYAYFRSDSGEISTWLTTDKIDYNFVC